MYDVFLSHNHKDRAAAELLARRLRVQGLNPFLDRWHLVPGEPWQEAIEQALDESETVAVFIGPSGVSPWHHEEMRTALAQAVRTRDEYRVIPVLLPGARQESVIGFLARRTWVDFRSGLDDEEAFARLVAGIKGEAVVSGTYELPDEPAPYRGLLRFEVEQAEFFFGRESETLDLLRRLEREHFLAVVGASGSGKSSLVRAGLLPKLATGALPDSREWHILVMTPTGQPLRELGAQLARLAPPGERLQLAEGIYGRLAEGPEGLFNAVAVLLAEHPRPVLLVIDQFEEVFTQCREDDESCRRRVSVLVANLAEAIRRGAGRVRVVITLRTAFLERCLAFPELKELLQDRQYLLGPLDAAGLREIIVRPAQQVGAFLEKGLVEAILKDVGTQPGRLPLLEHALYELWLRRRGPWLTLDGYTESGGVSGALQRTARATYQALTPKQQELARNTFLRLTGVGDGETYYRRRARREELYPLGVKAAQVEAVLGALSGPQARLIVVDEDSVEIAHEALIQGWQELKDWLEAEQEALRIQQQLNQAVQAWQALKGEQDALYRGVRLDQALEWAKSHRQLITPQEEAFLQASRELREQEAAEKEAQHQRELELERHRTEAEQQRAEAERQRAEVQTRSSRRLRVLARVLAAVFVLALAAAVTAGFLWRRAARQAQVATSRQLAAQAVEALASQQPIDFSLLLAVESWRAMQGSGLGPIVEADDALRRTLAEAPELMVRGGGSAVAFSPNGQTFATGSSDSARLWDASSGRELAVLQHGEVATAVAFSPNSARLAIGSDEGVVRVWSLDKGADLVVLRHGLDPPVKQVVFSPNGRWLVARYEEPKLGRREVRLWDTIAGSEWIPPEECPLIEDVTFSAGGSRIAVAAFTGACLLEADTGLLSALLPTDYDSDTVQFSLDGNSLLIAGHQDASVWDVESRTQRAIWYDVWAEAFTLSPDGVRLAIVEGGVRLGPDGRPADNLLEDFRVVVRDTNTSRDMAVMHHSSPVDGVRFNADGSRLVTWSRDGTIRVWDAGLASELAAFRHGFALSALDFSDDGNRLASAGGFTVHVWEFAKGSELQHPLGWTLNPGSVWTTFLPARPIVDLGSFRHDEPVVGLAFSPDGGRLVTTSQDGTTRLWDARGGQEPLRLRHEDGVNGFDLNSDGSQLASATSFGARVWDVAAGREVVRFGAVDLVSHVAASPDGRLVANFSLLVHHVVLLDVASGHTVATLKHGDGVNDVAFRPDSLRVATASSDGTACLWEAESGDKLHILPHEDAVEQVVWSADGSRLVTFAGGAVRVWDAASGQELEMVHGERRYDALAISAEGVLLGATKVKHAVQVWDVARNWLLSTLSHHDWVPAVAFSFDGSVVATARGDGTAGLWEARTGQPLAVLRPGAGVYNLSFSSDGMWLATAGNDMNVRVWRVRTQDLAAQACQIAGRNLTLEEWKAYAGGAARYRCTCPNLPPGEGAPSDACAGTG